MVRVRVKDRARARDRARHRDRARDRDRVRARDGDRARARPRARHLGVACVRLFLLSGGRVLAVVGHRVTLGLKLRDGLVQLRNGRRDVGQLDDVAPGQGRYREIQGAT